MTRPVPYVDAFVAQCPTREVLDRISSKWVSLVLVALADGPSGYRELLRRIEGVSPKMLTQTLRFLEEDGIVRLEYTADVPARSSYELTDLGRTLLPVLAAVKQWAEDHMPQVVAALDRAGAARAVT
ncbi:MAG TPA: helix-turn-helix domain-containing protein [Actinocrinis sp.]